MPPYSLTVHRHRHRGHSKSRESGAPDRPHRTAFANKSAPTVLSRAPTAPFQFTDIADQKKQSKPNPLYPITFPPTQSIWHTFCFEPNQNGMSRHSALRALGTQEFHQGELGFRLMRISAGPRVFRS
jgi:hypothetical protein